MAVRLNGEAFGRGRLTRVRLAAAIARQGRRCGTGDGDEHCGYHPTTGHAGPAPIIAGAPANLAVCLSYRALPPTPAGGQEVASSWSHPPLASSRWSPRVARTLVLGSFVLAATTAWTPPARAIAEVPASLTDQAFWQLVTGASEAGGTFSSNNWVSNELVFQTVLPDLVTRVARGGVYLGVGPDQNFTYIVGLRPSIAFIVDIRRQNMLQHLLFKAVIELSPTRVEFASRMFSRPRPSGIDVNATPDAILSAVAQQEPDERLYRQTLTQALDLLKRKRGFGLTPDDERTIEYVLQTFFEFGPDLTYSPIPMRGASFGALRLAASSPYPSFADLMNETDGRGVNRAYLASEASYKVLREMQQKNLIVPLVGDFGGDKALRAVGKWVRDHNATVTTFYTSNVEQYSLPEQRLARVLRQRRDAAAGPIEHVHPIVFSRPVPGRAMPDRQGGVRPPPELSAAANAMPLPSATLLCSIQELLAAVKAGRIENYFDVIDLSMGQK